MKDYIFTDLACENISDYKNNFLNNHEYEDLKFNIFKSRIIIETVEDQLLFGRSAGECVSFFTPHIAALDDETFFYLCQNISEEIKRLIKKNSQEKDLNSDFSVLIAGLGNPALNPDALGPQTVKNITVTRGIIDNENHFCVSAVIPDVKGNTGINTVDILKCYVNCIKPNILLVVDSLRARKSERLASTIEISDCGISPGSGIGNAEKAISKDSLNIPVISIGIPTVVNSATLVADILGDLGIEKPSNVMQKALNNGKNFFVTPTEIELVIKFSSLLLSKSIDMAMIL